MSSSVLTTSSIRWLAFAAAAVMALGVGHDLLHMPLQIGDSLAPLLDAVRGSSPWSEFRGHLGQEGYLRPMRFAVIKAVSDLSNGYYFFGYRLFHAALVLAFLLLFVRALEVRDRLTLVVVPFALTVFVGLHTFLGTVKEIYPTNHFLQIAVLALLALNLAQSRGGVVIDVLLAATFTVAALTLESGLLTWVVIVSAWIVGMPGVSRRAALAVTVLLGGYALLRFIVLGTGVPTVDERSTGFLLETLDPGQIHTRFGDNMLPLYVYNVASSLSSVLLSEPRSGVWVFVRAIRGDQLAPRHFIQIGASLFATGLLVAYVVQRLRSGVRWPVTLVDQHAAIFAAVLAANAVMSYVYTKDEIMSTAGAFYALPVAGAAVYFLQRWSAQPRSVAMTAAVCLLCLAGSLAWATRAAGVHHVLRSQAFVQRNDWTRLDREWSRDGNWERYRQQAPLVRQLQHEAISTPVVNPYFEPRWMERVFDIYY